MKKIGQFFLAFSLFLTIPAVTFADNSIARASGLSDVALASVLGFIAVLLALVVWVLSKSIESVNNSIAKSKEKEAPVKQSAFGGFILLAATEPLFELSDTVFWVMATIILILLGLMFNLMATLKTMLRALNGDTFEPVEDSKDIFEELRLTDRVPIEEEETIMMDHEYDGIRELDNNLPPWWVYGFYATIIFAVVYIVRFHITGSGPLSHEEYNTEMAIAAEKKAKIMERLASQVNEENVVYLVDGPSLDKGAKIYKGNCATCHGNLGEGGAGPNLTDEYWIHGGDIKNVFSTIKYGVASKGMIAWEDQLGPAKMQQVASYILSLKGSNPPNAKEPQGELHVEKVMTEEGDTAAIVMETD